MSSKGAYLSRFLFLCLIWTLSLCSIASADDEPLWEDLKRRVKSPVFSIGALLQAVGTFESNATQVPLNGFTLANARLRFRGQLDRGWGYFVQFSFTKSPAVLHAYVSYAPWRPLAEFRMGAMKAPFSAEFLISAGRIDFVRRSQIVTALAPGFQVGMQVGGKTEMGLGYAVGAFNGNGLSITNDNNDLMTVGRINFEKANDQGTQSVETGVNVYHSNDADAPIGVPITGDFIAQGYSGERLVGGADARLSLGKWLVTSELLAGRYDPRGGSRVEPWGYQVTAGFSPSRQVQLLGRWDSFRPDGVLDDSDLVILGLNFWPTSPTEIQTNISIPTIGERAARFAMNVQVLF